MIFPDRRNDKFVVFSEAETTPNIVSRAILWYNFAVIENRKYGRRMQNAGDNHTDQKGMGI